MVKLKDFSKPLSVFQVLFKANLFLMTFQDSHVYSSTFQACANPEASYLGQHSLLVYPFCSFQLILCQQSSIKDILANSEAQGDMPQNVTFHQGLYCLHT